MLEVEQKYARADFVALEASLTRLGATTGVSREDTDHYFNAPDRDFVQTREAFRLRRIGHANYLTYKGPRRDPTVKIRPELEIALRDGDDAAREMLEMLGLLGFRAVAVVHKRRRTFHLPRQGYAVEVCLDELTGVGRFAELEILAPEAEMEKARTALIDTAAQLGLTEVEPRSYLALYLASRSSGESLP